jgi:hypothetical protein
VFRPPSRNLWVATEKVIVRLREEDNTAGHLPFAKDPRVLKHALLPGTSDTYLLTLSDSAAGTGALAMANELADSGLYLWAAPDAVQQWRKYSLPNDPLLNRQWHLRNLGGSLNGNPGQDSLAGADAKVFEAWALVGGGSPSVVVAVLDDGPELSHPDLAPNLFENPGEIPGNGIDDDNNGFIDDVRGWDFTSLPGDNDAGHSQNADEHGTSVAGVIAARGNNGIGVAGAAYNVRWFSSRVFNGSTAASDAGFAAAVNYASGRPGHWLFPLAGRRDHEQFLGRRQPGCRPHRCLLLGRHQRARRSRRAPPDRLRKRLRRQPVLPRLPGGLAAQCDGDRREHRSATSAPTTPTPAPASISSRPQTAAPTRSSPWTAQVPMVTTRATMRARAATALASAAPARRPRSPPAWQPSCSARAPD